MTCSIQGCPNKAVVRGLCSMHYMRARRTGDATRARQRGPKPKSFVDPEVSKTEGQVITELRRQLAQAKARVTELAGASLRPRPESISCKSRTHAAEEQPGSAPMR